MTKKLAISVPDDVAARLAQESNVSAFITDVLRQKMAGERTINELRLAGFQITEEGMARAEAEIQALRAAVTPELLKQAAELQARIKGGQPW